MSKKVIGALALVAVIMTMSGCKKDNDPVYGDKSKEEVIEMLENVQSQLNSVQKKYDSLMTIYEGIQADQKPTAAISMTGDGTNRYTFNSIDNEIVFIKPFEYPGAEFVPSNGSISIVPNVIIQPSANWVSKIGSCSLELEHINGISGTIKVAKQNYLFSSEQLQSGAFKEFFEGLPASNITYSDIAVSGVKLGSQAVTPTLIDSGDAYIRCGMFGIDNKCVVYTFAYKGEKDAAKDEAITSLLNTITINGNKVIVEQ